MIKLLVAIGAALSLALGAGAWSQYSPRQIWSIGVGAFRSADDIDYLTAEVTNGRIRRIITATGSLQAVSTVEVSSQLSGQIARLHADFNDTVATGQPLAELDQRGFVARVQQAEAELEMAHENVAILAARLDKARGVEQEELVRRKIFRARIDKARVKLASAERRRERTEVLVKRGSSSQTSIDDARSDLDTATAELREAMAIAEAHEHVVASSRAGRLEAEAELANARAALPLQRATLALAELDLERSTIRAPIDGVLVGRNVEQGQTVATSLDAPTLFTIAGDLAQMEIHANIDETDIGKIALGQSATFTVDAFHGRSFAAVVREIRKSARIVQSVVIYTVVLEVSNPRRLLLPGMTATVRISIDEVGPVRIVPLAALRFSPERRGSGKGAGSSTDDDSGERTVWVLDQGRAPQPRRIRLGTDDGRDVAVLDGELMPGEQVITGRISRPGNRRLFGIRF